MKKGFQWRVLDVFSFSFFFLFAGFSPENALNSKLCLHQDFWSLTILLAGWAGIAYGEPLRQSHEPLPRTRPCTSWCIDLLSAP